MDNKRVSELSPITAPQLDFADLLLLSDISAHESKKLQVGDLKNFLLLYGLLTGSILGTASYAMNAATASYFPAVSASYSKTSSWAYNVNTSSYALSTLSSSYSQNSLFSTTSSYALTSSVELVYSSSFSNYARTASYLLLIPGQPNGAASYALTASSALNANNLSLRAGNLMQITSSGAVGIQSIGDNISIAADGNVYLSSGIDGDGVYLSAGTELFVGGRLAIDQNATSSYAKRALSVSLVDTASFLAFNGVSNGTASYALVAGSTLNVIKDYGIFAAMSQSVSSSQLDMMTVTPSLGGTKTTIVEAYGTIVVPFTSSGGPTNGNIELIVVDRQYGYLQSLDSSIIYSSIGGSSTSISGTLKYPFTLCGDAKLYGLYEV